MSETQSYLQMMIESLRKKVGVLSDILEKNEAQAACITDREYGEINWDKFNVLIAEKEALINRINELDGGFESLYQRVRNEVLEHKEMYRNEVKTMQDLISELTDMSVEIQTGEERNRASIERIMMNAKKEIKQSRKNMKVVSNYYKTMSNPTGEILGTMDKKK